MLILARVLASYDIQVFVEFYEYRINFRMGLKESLYHMCELVIFPSKLLRVIDGLMLCTIVSRSKLAIMVIFDVCVESAYRREIDNVYQATCNSAVNLRCK